MFSTSWREAASAVEAFDLPQKRYTDLVITTAPHRATGLQFVACKPILCVLAEGFGAREIAAARGVRVDPERIDASVEVAVHRQHEMRLAVDAAVGR